MLQLFQGNYIGSYAAHAEPETLQLKWEPLYSLTTSKQKSEILNMEAHLWGENAERDIRRSQGVKMSMSLSLH